MPIIFITLKENMKRFCLNLDEKSAKKIELLRVVSKEEFDKKARALMSKLADEMCHEKGVEVNLSGVCKRCGCKMVERTSKFGKFMGCSAHPKCKYTEKVGK